MDAAERVRELVAPLVEEMGLELVEVEHGSGILRITLDRDGGIDLEAITDASEEISSLLDLHDPIPGGRYTLECSSPGLERPLRTPAQFQRYVGAVVNVKTNPGVEGERRIEGAIDEADDTGIVIEGRRLAYGDIERARTVFQWGPQSKPGKKQAPGKQKQKRAKTS